jgi:hypothetical protein
MPRLWLWFFVGGIMEMTRDKTKARRTIHGRIGRCKL